MPCRDDRDDDCIANARSEAATATAAAEKRAYLLCEACTLLEEAGLLSQASEELKKWYSLHEALEADRLRLEAALKLSTRERRVLGIDLQSLQLKLVK